MRRIAFFVGVLLPNLLLVASQDLCARGPLQPRNEPICSANTYVAKHEKHENTLENSPEEWDGPDDCVEEHCIFSHQTFGGGMVMITTERIAEIVAGLNAVDDAGSKAPPFRIAQFPGKGMGLVATRAIRKGEIIMERTPSLLVQWGMLLEMDPEIRDRLFALAVERLPALKKQAFMRQMGDSIHDKVDRNTFRLFLDGNSGQSTHLGSFPEISMMNHDCRPNVHYRIANITHTTVAVRDILPGEELTISYIFGMIPRHERHERLIDWGFTCTCPHCTMSPADLAASDARLEEIKRLEDDLETKLGSGRTVAPEAGGDIVKLYLDEKLYSYLGPAYTRAALVYSMFGNMDKAKEYAAEAAEALVRETGPQSKDAEAMRKLVDDPTKHWSWQVQL
ncbi:hypothetical protein B0T19DRAFT_22795 [Cercophora scortea]|uniref:SET domain-containing protein n=1 Tax=Cercophora scortea TaxID=314031 RepID=A0AAE0J2T0_9PEZI|nr:hypothetical protein B0T19DRAFT_22795 [Cercophora scortea]